jgi:DNA-binding NarL/FixJ family response regulator
MLERRADFQIIGQASDGFEAVQKAQALRPDLILLDIGLPKLNGIEVARKLASGAKILFLSQESSPDVVREALGSGGLGYVQKQHTHNELLPAVEAVLRGNQFVGGGLEDHQFGEDTNAKRQLLHEVQFYSDDTVFLESFTQFIAAALKAGKAVIVLVTESHRQGLLQKLKEQGLDVATAIESGILVPLDNAETLSTFMVNDMPDPTRLFEIAGSLIQKAAKAASRDQNPRVAACGECAPLLWAEGKVDAAIRLEQLWDQLVKTHELDTLCAYPLASSEKDSPVLQCICAEHSAVHSR